MVMAMASLTVRNLPDSTHRALRLRAVEHGRSTEAEVRAILDEAVRPVKGLGASLREIGASLGGVDLSGLRDQRPVDAADFS